MIFPHGSERRRCCVIGYTSLQLTAQIVVQSHTAIQQLPTVLLQ